MANVKRLREKVAALAAKYLPTHEMDVDMILWNVARNCEGNPTDADLEYEVEVFYNNN